MGEWSKKIGEYGEDVVEKFFSVIGWNDLSKGESIPCINPTKHLTEEDKPKTTHGIDFLYSYPNPLVSEQLCNIIISSKFQSKKYPNNPTTVFKKHMEDLITTLECFDGSDLKTGILSGFEHSSTNDVGVLFWLNNQHESDDDLISSVASVRVLDTQISNAIFIMDNKRVAFILEVMKYVKIKNNKFMHSFFYPNTGRNINPQGRQNSGTRLPVEFLNSSIIPIRLVNKDNPKDINLLLATIDNFEEEDFIRLIGLAKDITTDWAGGVTIAFPDYDDLSHKGIVAQSKQKFQLPEFTKTVDVVNFNNHLEVF